jgi:hypothetical protein
MDAPGYYHQPPNQYLIAPSTQQQQQQQQVAAANMTGDNNNNGAGVTTSTTSTTTLALTTVTPYQLHQRIKAGCVAAWQVAVTQHPMYQSVNADRTASSYMSSNGAGSTGTGGLHSPHAHAQDVVSRSSSRMVSIQSSRSKGSACADGHDGQRQNPQSQVSRPWHKTRHAQMGSDRRRRWRKG